MTNATDKQISYAKVLGVDVSQMSKEQASTVIDGLKTAKGLGYAHKSSEMPKETPAKQKYFDTSSYYVSYAKDLVIAMLDNEKFKGIAPDLLMENAINCIKQAKEAFK